MLLVAEKKRGHAVPMWYRVTTPPPCVRYAMESKLDAERELGDILRNTPKNQGAIPGKTGTKAVPVLDDTPTLRDLGIPSPPPCRGAGIHKKAKGSIVTGNERVPVKDDTPTLYCGLRHHAAEQAF